MERHRAQGEVFLLTFLFIGLLAIAGQHLCFNGHKLLSIRQTGARQRLLYPASESVPDSGAPA